MSSNTLRHKIDDKTAKIGIIGLGYVGLPLAVEFAGNGFTVLGIDTDLNKVEQLNRGNNYIADVDSQALKQLVAEGRIEATTMYGRVGELDAIFICVPTPFTRNKEPDISYITSAAQNLSEHLRKEQLIILKSTTFPETTEKVLLPILESTGLKVGRDFYLAFSPERIDPGRKDFTTKNTPVIVGGVTPECTQLATALCEQIIERVVQVSSPRTAEMAKLLENIFRSVNIALVNELAQLCDRMENIDIWEVVDAAATKPFGFMPFYPGPGIGGHCILVDPYYLSWKAKEYDFHSDFIELAARTNENMPFYVLDLIIRSLSLDGAPLKTARFLFLGVAFKRDVDDIRNSPAIKIMELLRHRGAQNVAYNDPYVKQLQLDGLTLQSQPLTDEVVRAADCVIITTAHSAYDFDAIIKNAKLVVDTRNATKSLANPTGKIVRLGSSLNQAHV
ncbi:MAG: nucleotide sugar dehydrogenase [Calditrichaeota bacterium]|nr:MAG: nucleotide sugar dehydrogenase [Calditrichota bacterium]